MDGHPPSLTVMLYSKIILSTCWKLDDDALVRNDGAISFLLYG